MAPDDLLRLLPTLLPPVRRWIADVVGGAQALGRPACSVADAALRACFPEEFLKGCRVVLTATVPKPPLRALGFSGPDPLGDGPLDGIALGTTYFVRAAADRPALHFHELVHLAQWRRLGTDNFLLAYGTGLALAGYRDSPLEAMAHTLQEEFAAGIPRLHLLEEIEQRTDTVWNAARGRLAAVGVNTTHSIHSDWIMGGRL